MANVSDFVPIPIYRLNFLYYPPLLVGTFAQRPSILVLFAERVFIHRQIKKSNHHFLTKQLWMNLKKNNKMKTKNRKVQ